MSPDRTALEKLLLAASAAAAAFALAAGILLLVAGPFAGLEYLALFAAVPAGLLALLPLPGRIFFLVVGALLIAAGFLMNLSGGHNPMMIVPFFGQCLVAAVVVAELSARALELLRPHGTE